MEKEKRLIDANALKEKLQNHHDFFVDGVGGFRYLTLKDKARVDEITHCIAEIVNAPTVDAVEVVRCKDCAYATCNPVKLTYGCRHPSGLRGFVNEGFYFCSYGERRTNERKSD